MNKNSEEKETNILTHFRIQSEGCICLPKQNPTVQKGEIRPYCHGYFWSGPRRFQRLVGSSPSAFLAWKFGVCMSHFFPEASSVGSGRRGQGEGPGPAGEEAEVQEGPGCHAGTMGCRVQALLPGNLFSQPNLLLGLRCRWSSRLCWGPWKNPTRFLQEGNRIMGPHPGQGDGHSQHTRITHLTRLLWSPARECRGSGPRGTDHTVPR